MNTVSTTTYKIPTTSGLFNDIHTLVLAIQGVSLITSHITLGRAEYAPHEAIAIEALYLQAKVMVPLSGAIHNAARNLSPEDLVLQVVSNLERPTHLHQTSQFQKFAKAIFKAFVVSYHEQYIGAIKSSFGASRTDWPDCWQMSWALRNAASHNGKVFESNRRAVGKVPAPINWLGLVHEISDDTVNPILDRVCGGDMLILLLELEEARTGAKLSV